MTFFLVIDLVFRIFLLFSLIFRIFTLLDIVHNLFLTRKTPFFTLFILSRTSDNTTSQNIAWGDECMGRPPTSNFGGPSPQSPRFPPLRGRLTHTQNKDKDRTMDRQRQRQTETQTDKDTDP